MGSRRRAAENERHKMECDSSGKVELWLEQRWKRPLSDRAIAQSYQQPERFGTHGAEPDVGTKIKYGHLSLLGG
jgi:hypothetical protein